MKLWGGRFQEATDPVFEAFGRSLDSDRRLLIYDLKSCMAHIEMLTTQGILEPSQASVLSDALRELRSEVGENIEVQGEDEDIHSWVERKLKEKVGDLSSAIRIGRSRNDLVVTDFRLYVKDACALLVSRLRELQTVLCTRAEEHQRDALPGYTHLQRAQPVLLSHHLLAHFWSLQRDIKRFEQCAEEADCCILGAGALGGSSWAVDPEQTAKSLGFSRVLDNSLDGVSDRDFALEFLFCCATCATHLSRMSQELVLWSSSEFSFVRFSDAWSTGSSLMPQKKNPDPAELVRGKAGLFVGNLVDLLTTVKALPLAYNRDLQQDKPPVFRSKEELDACLQVLKGTYHTLTFRVDVMRAAAEDTTLLVTDLADALVRRGVPFSKAHHLAGRSLSSAEEHSDEDMSLIQACWAELNLDSALQARSHQGAAGHASVRRQLKKAKMLLTARRS